MNQDDAQHVFRIIAEIHGDLRTRLVVSRWWLIWGVMGVLTLTTSLVSQWLTGEPRAAVWLHAVVWSVHIAVTLLAIRILHRKSGGQR